MKAILLIVAVILLTTCNKDEERRKDYGQCKIIIEAGAATGLYVVEYTANGQTSKQTTSGNFTKEFNAELWTPVILKVYALDRSQRHEDYGVTLSVTYNGNESKTVGCWCDYEIEFNCKLQVVDR